MRLTPIRLVYGAALLAAPGAVLRACGGPDDGRARLYARVLGARQLAEGALLLAHGEPAWALGGAAVDGVHAISAVALAARTTRYRRLALLNAGGAAALTLAGVRGGSR
jgi:hypothetical protein